MNQFLNNDNHILNFNLDIESYKLKNLRNKNFSSLMNFISWDINELDVIKKEFSLPGGSHYILNFDNNQYAIIDLRDKLKLKIKEFYIFKENFNNFIKTLLLSYQQYELFEFLLPDNNYYSDFFNKEYNLENFAMFKQISTNTENLSYPIYFNLGLDS